MIVFVLNRIDDLVPERTTTRLIHACLHRGHRVAITDVHSLSVRSTSSVHIRAVVFSKPQAARELCAAVPRRARVDVPADQIDIVVIRTSPGRDLEHAWAHRFMLHALRLLRDDGVRVVNDPLGLERASSKLYAACLPEGLTPPTLVARAWEDILAFIDEINGTVVIKPLLGSGGRDVFFVRNGEMSNARQICELLGRTGYIVVQGFLPEAAKGDKRVLLLDGSILTADGREAVVARVPRAGELRSNVGLGADVRAAELTDEERYAARSAAKLLRRDGIRFAGLDIVDGQILEANVYSTGGLVDAERFYGANYAAEVMTALMSDERTAAATPD